MTQKQMEIIEYWRAGLSNGNAIARILKCSPAHANRTIGLYITHRIRIDRVEVHKEIRCLRCNEPFVSIHKGYRICPACRRKIKELS